jgi:hypothetical protein
VNRRRSGVGVTLPALLFALFPCVSIAAEPDRNTTVDFLSDLLLGGGTIGRGDWSGDILAVGIDDNEPATILLSAKSRFGRNGFFIPIQSISLREEDLQQRIFITCNSGACIRDTQPDGHEEGWVDCFFEVPNYQDGDRLFRALKRLQTFYPSPKPLPFP